MTEPRRLHAVAVLRQENDAAALQRRLRAAGIEDGAISVGDHDDAVASLRAEMRDEMENSLTSPQLGVAWTKEGLKGIVALAPVAAIVCTLLALPITFLATPDWSIWLKILLAVVVGAFTGGTIAIVAGAAGTRGPAEPLAAEKGVTVRVANATPEVLELLRASDPIRLDIVLPDGTPIGETITEDDDNAVAVTADRLLHQTDTDWEDEAVRDDRSSDARRATWPGP